MLFRDGVDGRWGRRYDLLFLQSEDIFGYGYLPGGEKYSYIRAGLSHRESSLSELQIFGYL